MFNQILRSLKQKKLILFLILLVFSLSGLSSCKKKKVCPLGQKRIGKTCKCKYNSNCPSDEVCKMGKCVKPVKKTHCPDIPCTGGKVCKSGTCSNCAKDSDCKDGKFCNNGLCKPNGNECSPDKDCPLGQKCVHGFCKKDKGPVPICTAGNCKAPCELYPLYFNYKETSLTKKSRKNLKLNLKCMKKAYKKGLKHIHILGLCDPRGPSTYNDDLSSLRIKAVQDEMILLDPSIMNKVSISTEPLGETCAMGEDEAGWQKDRRVEIIWFKKQGQVCP